MRAWIPCRIDVRRLRQNASSAHPGRKHWFEHADQPAEGRFDGENSNFGTVTIEDSVYAELTETMTRVNAAAEQIHAEAAHTE